MPHFKVFHIMEHVDGEVDRLDNRIIILYDKEEETFYYYGTRNGDDQSSYVYYQDSYPITKLDAFVDFLDYMLNNLYEVITTELHVVDIQEYEYSTLNYKKIKTKMNKGSLLSAYDTKKETIETIYKYLNMLDNSV